MTNAHCRTWNMVRKMKNVENETQKLFDLEQGKKNTKLGKREKHTVGPGIGRETLKKLKNEKCITVGPGI